MVSCRALARKEKNSAFWMNWEIKRSWGSGYTVSPTMGSGKVVGKALEESTIFGVKVVWSNKFILLVVQMIWFYLEYATVLNIAFYLFNGGVSSFFLFSLKFIYFLMKLLKWVYIGNNFIDSVFDTPIDFHIK